MTQEELLAQFYSAPMDIQDYVGGVDTMTPYSNYTGSLQPSGTGYAERFTRDGKEYVRVAQLNAGGASGGELIDPNKLKYDDQYGYYTEADNYNLRQSGLWEQLAPFAMLAPAGYGLYSAGAGAAASGAMTQAEMLAAQEMGFSAADIAAWQGGASQMTQQAMLAAQEAGFSAEEIAAWQAGGADVGQATQALISRGVSPSSASGIAGTLGNYGGLLSAGIGAAVGGSGPSSGTTTTTSGPPEWLNNYLQQYVGEAENVARNSQYTPMNNYQNDALQGIASQAMAGSPANDAGQQQITDTLNGAYLNSNPYLDYNINKAQNDLVQQYQLGTAAQTDASAARSHALGGSSYNQLTAYNNDNLANQLNNVDASMRGANYTNERNNQMSALGQVPGMVNTGYADWNNLYNAGNTLQQQQQQQDQWGEHQLGIADQALRTSLGGGGTVQSSPWEANKTAGLLGGAATGLSLWNAYK